MAKPRTIPKETISRAVNSLLKWLRSKKKSNQNQDDFFIYLILTLKQIPHRGRSLSFRIPLPHPVHHPVSLIFDDRGSGGGPHSLPSLSLPLTDLIPFSEVRSHGATPVGLLLVDRCIARLLPKGKKGEDGGVRVVEVVDMGKKWWPEAVRRIVGSTEMRFRGGTCCGIRVGRAGMAAEEIAENVAAAVEGAVANVPKKWGNVRGLHVKAAESVALPIYDAAAEELDAAEMNGEAKRSRLGHES